MYAPTAPAANMALKLRRAGWRTRDMMLMKRIPARAGPMKDMGAVADTPDIYPSSTESMYSAMMEPVARKTIFAGFKPNTTRGPKHRVAVLAYDGVVLGDLAAPLEIFGRVHDPEGR